jgi:hypothetical protein
MGVSSDAVAVLIIGFVMILSFFLGPHLAIKKFFLIRSPKAYDLVKYMLNAIHLAEMV